MPKALKKELFKEAKIQSLEILKASKTVPPMVPVDTGALQSTGRIIEPSFEGNKILAGVEYGGFADSPYNVFVDYAKIVHDDTRKRNWKKPGSGPKFVSTHIWRRRSEIKQALLAALKRGKEKVFG